MVSGNDAHPSASRLEWGGRLFVLVGVGLVVYALVFSAWVFAGGTLELGIDADAVGVSRDEIAATSPALLDYIDHLHLAVGGFMLGLGLAVAGLAWFGIRSAAPWALWVTLLALVSALVVATPLHYVHGFTDPMHIGPLYGGVAVAALAAWLAWSGSHIVGAPGKR